ncbi:hypothetical protein H0H93_007945 [Arthromyces matolae]|nr:hypothetical protein H0H93_007945 [Arthromyces matolae]
MQIEDTLFKVPRFVLTSNSLVFADMFMIPQGTAADVEGSSDNNPITLDQVKKDDFRNLMKVILPLDVPPSQPTLSKDEWIAVLGLADLWQMHKIRLHCIKMLTPIGMPGVELVVLAKKYHVPQWLRSGYHDLVNQHKTPSLADAKRLGWPSAIKVFQVRENSRNSYHNRYPTPTPTTTTTNNFSFEAVFGDEFAEEEAEYERYTSTGTNASTSHST